MVFMRILRIVSSKDSGGILTYELQFIKEMKARGIIVDAVILGKSDQAKYYEGLCDKCYYLPHLNASYSGSFTNMMLAIWKTYTFGTKYARKLKKIFETNANYHALLYSRPTYIHLAGFLAQTLKVTPMWHLPNAVRGMFGKYYYIFFCRRYGIVQIANSQFTQNTLGTHCKHVVYPGYEEERVANSLPYFRNLLGISDKSTVYGVAARMHFDKAQDIIVTAFINSNVTKKGGHLLLAGGPLDSAFGQEVQKRAGSFIGKQIHFLGVIQNLNDFYSSVDIVINGRRNVEPFGISVAEGFGAGKPVIAYRLGGPSEMIQDRHNGWLVNCPTVEEYTQAFNLTLADRGDWATMGSNAKLSAQKYAVKENVDTLLRIINHYHSKNSSRQDTFQLTT